MFGHCHSNTPPRPATTSSTAAPLINSRYERFGRNARRSLRLPAGLAAARIRGGGGRVSSVVNDGSSIGSWKCIRQRMQVVILVPRVEHPRFAPFVFGRRRRISVARGLRGAATPPNSFASVTTSRKSCIPASPPERRSASDRRSGWRDDGAGIGGSGGGSGAGSGMPWSNIELAVLRVRHPRRGRRWWRRQRTPPAITAALDTAVPNAAAARIPAGSRPSDRARASASAAFAAGPTAGMAEAAAQMPARAACPRRDWAVRHDWAVPACAASMPTGARWVELSRRLSLDLADQLLEREALARDVGFRQGRRHAAQLGDQRRARALVERTAVLAVVLLQTGDRAGYERVIIGHRFQLTRSAL